ncbi:Uncharacterised protein [Mycobacteroides abscessus subsp. massiliense]|uniref:Uncharacterized protein n=1 Tax=Mycobacteroides abscessus subsp. massiliense TaxID=1962118 RepID=A0A1T8V4Y9_9MYCO|nr:hypothetical protein [Mycobacteroides abscessus]SKM99918.1 Uncharacterised protein [Mycobacteroides abscessus subsp. massiliense]
MAAMSDLATLETEVAVEYFALVAERTPGDPFNPLTTKWLRVDRPGFPLVAFEMQFPREQWAVLPTRRKVTLLLMRRAIELIRQLPDDDARAADLYIQVGFPFMYGGKVRVA